MGGGRRWGTCATTAGWQCASCYRVCLMLLCIAARRCSVMGLEGWLLQNTQISTIWRLHYVVAI